MKLAYLVAAIASLAAAPAFAQGAAQPSGPEDVKVNQLIIYGSDPCPQSTDEEIIVCARKPEGDRFRIPDILRTEPEDRANSWANRATEIEYLGKSGIGSCSTSGPGGMIGCFNDIIRDARAERATRDSVNWSRLIEDARQERLGRIDAEAEAAEAESPR